MHVLRDHYKTVFCSLPCLILIDYQLSAYHSIEGNTWGIDVENEFIPSSLLYLLLPAKWWFGDLHSCCLKFKLLSELILVLVKRSDALEKDDTPAVCWMYEMTWENLVLSLLEYPVCRLSRADHMSSSLPCSHVAINNGSMFSGVLLGNLIMQTSKFTYTSLDSSDQCDC